MYFNGFENPKLAAIRLLRSQGCCNSHQAPQQQQPPQTISGQLQSLLRYKQQLESKVAHQRSKMSEIPCAIELTQEIEQLQELIEGLSRENRQRVRQIENMTKEGASTFSTDLEDEEEDVRENQRLQAEYNALMKKLERVNDRNTMLVNKLINM